MKNKVHGQSSPNDIQKRKDALGQALMQAQKQPNNQIKNTNPQHPARAVGTSQPNKNTKPMQSVQSTVSQQLATSNNVGTVGQNVPTAQSNQAQGNTVANTSSTNTPDTSAIPQSSTPTYLYDSNTDYSNLINSAVASGNYQQAAIYEQQRNAKIAAEGLNYQQTNYYADYLPGGSKYGTPTYTYTYDSNTDYSALINEAVAAGNYQQAAIYEQQRNAKIAAEGLSYAQTNKYADYLPGGTKYGTVQIAPNDMSPLINQMYDAQAQQIKNQVNYETQGAVDQLNRALQDAQPTYEAAIANQLLETKQALDAQALRKQVNGDRGGIGSAQISSIGNTGAKNREAIAQQQRQLATDTARQIADLRAQGKYQEANLLLQNSQQKLAALYEEQVRMQQQEAEQKNILFELGTQYLSAGLMPSDDMLSAMGIDAPIAQKYIDFYKAQQQNSYSSGGNSGVVTGPSPIDDDGFVFEKINGMDELEQTAQQLIRSGNFDNYDEVAPKLYELLDRGNITFNEAVYVAYCWMLREGSTNINNDEDFARLFYNSYLAYKGGAFDDQT